MPNIAATLSLNVPAITALCKGAPGTSLLFGGNNPTTQGNNGDFYLNNVTYELFGPKAAGSWPPAGTLLTNTVSAQIWNVGYTATRSNSANWNNSYTTLRGNSADWMNVETVVMNNSAAFTEVQGNSANWRNVYTLVRGNSAGWGGTTAASVFTTVQAYSANWQNTYNSVSSLSATWGAGGGGAGFDLGVRALTANWQNTWTVMRPFSADRWTNVYFTVSALSADWNNAYSTTRTNSADWSEGTQAYNLLNPISAEIVNATTYVENNSATLGSAVATVSSLSANWDWTYNAYTTAVSVSSEYWNQTYNAVLTVINDPLVGTFTKAELWDASSTQVRTAYISGWGPRYATLPTDVPFTPGNNSFVITQSMHDAVLGIILNTANADLTASIPHTGGGFIPSQDSIAYGTKIDLLQLGTSQIFVSAGRGITLNVNSSRVRTRGQYTAGTLVKTGTTTWTFYGDTVIK